MFGIHVVRPQAAGKLHRFSAAITAAALLGAILFAFGPAEAKPSTQASCHKKYLSCQTRCADKIQQYTGTEWNDKLSACMKRTCDKQYDNCVKNSTGPGGGDSKLENPPPAHKPRPEQASGSYISDPKPVPNPLTSTTNNSAPLATGILDSGSRMGGNGPSATGSPAGGGMKPPSAPPAAPPVILR